MAPAIKAFRRHTNLEENAMADYDPQRVRKFERPHGLPFRIGKIGHVVLNVRDVERSTRFYTEVLGFEISDVVRAWTAAGETTLRNIHPARPTLAAAPPASNAISETPH
jgi:hypothetical protein